MPRVTVRIPPALRPFTEGLSELEAEGDTLRGLLEGLDQRHAGLRPRMLTPEGELRPFVNVFLDSDNARQLRGLDTPLREGGVVHILPAVAGG